MTPDDATASRRVRFDPTINLGHVLTAGVFLVSTGVAYATVTVRLDHSDREILRVERQAKESIDRAELRWAADQQRDRDAFVEIKLLLREINLKLDTKQDKPR